MAFTTLDDLQTGRVPATLTVRGLVINVEYDPDSITGDFLAEMRRDAPEDQVAQVEQLAELLCRILCVWDLRESAEGPVVPLTVKRLMGLPVAILNEIATAIPQAVRMGEANGTPSPRRSSPSATSNRRASSRR